MKRFRIRPYGGRYEANGYKVQVRKFGIWWTLSSFKSREDAETELKYALSGGFEPQSDAAFRS